MTEDVELMTKVGARWQTFPVTLSYEKGRILFLNSPKALKGEIKAMAGAKWHGYDDPTRMYWSVLDSPRNRFQLAFMKGEDVYAHFDQRVVQHEYRRPLFAHQRAMADHFLTYHYGVMAAEMGTGKTLALQEVMERGGAGKWIWVGPKSSLVNVTREFKRWQLAEYVDVTMMSYEKFAAWAKTFRDGVDETPLGLVFDEASRLKNHDVQRSQAAQTMADRVRAAHGMKGFAILASGTPSPKSPADWWSPCEIAWPGFLKEGSEKALRERLAIMVKREFDAGVYNQIAAWRDDERRCETCGDFEQSEQHGDGEGLHRYIPCGFNEVEYLHKRLKGLVIVFLKKDVLAELPEKRYLKIECTPDPGVLRAAKAIASASTSAVTAFTALRELSDGFQYREKVDGTTRCTTCEKACGEVTEWFHPERPDQTFRQIDLFDETFVAGLESRVVPCPSCEGSGQMPRRVRETVELPCPKDAALKELLDENEEVGRIVVFAGFTGSVDRIMRLCREKKWATVRCDGRGLSVFGADGKPIPKVNPLEFWSDLESNPVVAWVSHPESGGMSFTLTEARTAVFWSNSFKSEFRSQAEDRIHRPGMDLNKGCLIVDLVQLPSDERALATLKEDRRLELMTLGEIQECYATSA